MLHRLTAIVIGYKSVGKTTFIERVVNNRFNQIPDETCGIYHKSLKISSSLMIDFFELGDYFEVKNYNIYTKRSDIVICVFDVTETDSFNFLKYVFENVLFKHENRENIYIIVNKMDKIKNNYSVVNHRQIESFIRKYNLVHSNIIKTSAKFNDLSFVLNIVFKSSAIDIKPQKKESKLRSCFNYCYNALTYINKKI
jgi:GTPase SAR1 family protein